jgi:hypothetical protein
MARSTCLALVVIAALGCAPKKSVPPGPPAPQPSPAKESPAVPEPPVSGNACRVTEMDSCKDELEAVARCFFDGVTAAQEEPGEKPLAVFLAANAPDVEACRSIGIDETCEKLLLSGGDEVTHTHEMVSHDHYADHDVMYIVYTFSAGSCPGKAEARIELHL